MNRGTLIGLALLLCALGGAAWWQLEREREGVFALEVPLFEDVGRADVTAITIDNLERSVRVRFERREDGWWIVDPLETRADGATLERLLEVVERNLGLVVPRSEADPARLGLDPPRAIVDVHVQRDGRAERLRVEVGRRDLDGRSLFVRTRGRVLRTLQTLDTQVDQEVQDYRSKRIFDLAGESVIEVNRVGRYRPSIDVEPIDMTLMAVREGASWRLLQPYQALLDPMAVAVLVAGAARLPADTFVEDAAPDVGRYGLDEPELSIELVTSGGRRATVHLARPGGGSNWLATREDRRTVVSIAPEDAPALLIPVEAMFDSILLRLARTEIDGLVLVTPERELELARRARGSWTVRERTAEESGYGPTHPVDPQRVDGLLARLEGAELQGFLPDFPWPADAPRLEVRVQARGHEFGGRLGPETADPDGGVARLFQREGDEVVALVGPWLAELAATPMSELLDPRLLALEEIHLGALSIEGARGRARFTRDERGRWSRTGEAGEATELLGLLDPLLFLRASQHLDPALAPALEDPLEVVFERSLGGRTLLRVGLGRDGEGRPRAEAEVEGSRAVLRVQDLHRRLSELLR